MPIWLTPPTSYRKVMSIMWFARSVTYSWTRLSAEKLGAIHDSVAPTSTHAVAKKRWQNHSTGSFISGHPRQATGGLPVYGLLFDSKGAPPRFGGI